MLRAYNDQFKVRNFFFVHLLEAGKTKNCIRCVFTGVSAAKQNKIEGLNEFLKGSTALAISYDEPVSPAKVIKNFCKDNDLPHVKGILFEGRVLPGEDFKKLAELPSKEQLLSKFMLLIRSPIQNFAYGLKNPMQNLVGVLNNLKENKN